MAIAANILVLAVYGVYKMVSPSVKKSFETTIEDSTKKAVEDPKAKDIKNNVSNKLEGDIHAVGERIEKYINSKGYDLTLQTQSSNVLTDFLNNPNITPTQKYYLNSLLERLKAKDNKNLNPTKHSAIKKAATKTATVNNSGRKGKNETKNKSAKTVSNKIKSSTNAAQQNNSSKSSNTSSDSSHGDKQAKDKKQS